mmetsp:Transcript_5381/g.16268  ORF Transcript_5381/g.16268 Transcript_5381/m.16268 type:complete len:309 (+) Transcript_5381:134-1060(+)
MLGAELGVLQSIGEGFGVELHRQLDGARQHEDPVLEVLPELVQLQRQVGGARGPVRPPRGLRPGERPEGDEGVEGGGGRAGARHERPRAQAREGGGPRQGHARLGEPDRLEAHGGRDAALPGQGALHPRLRLLRCDRGRWPGHGHRDRGEGHRVPGPDGDVLRGGRRGRLGRVLRGVLLPPLVEGRSDSRVQRPQGARGAPPGRPHRLPGPVHGVRRQVAPGRPAGQPEEGPEGSRPRGLHGHRVFWGSARKGGRGPGHGHGVGRQDAGGRQADQVGLGQVPRGGQGHQLQSAGLGGRPRGPGVRHDL